MSALKLQDLSGENTSIPEGESVLFDKQDAKIWGLDESQVLTGRLTLTNTRIMWVQDGTNTGFIYTWPQLSLYGISGTPTDEDKAADAEADEKTETKEDGVSAKCSILCSFMIDELAEEAEEEEEDDAMDGVFNVFITFDDIAALEAARLVFDERYVNDQDIDDLVKFGDEDEDEDREDFGEMDQDFVLEE